MLQTHPEPKRRLEKIISESRTNLKMPSLAKFLEKESVALSSLSTMKDKKSTTTSIDVDTLFDEVEKAIAPVRSKASKYSKFVLTPEGIKGSISQSMWFRTSIDRKEARKKLIPLNFQKMLKKIGSDILEGKPIVVDPPVIYYLVISNFISSPKKLKRIEGKTENAQMLREFIADLVRLYYVQSQFMQIKRTKQSLEKRLKGLLKKIQPG